MGFRQATNEWLSIVLKIGIIVVVALIIGYGGLSIWGNIIEDKVVDLPNKADYIFTLTATGQDILTSDYEIINDGRYLLHGYYELIKGKWKFRDSDICLDTFYFGDIIVKRR